MYADNSVSMYIIYIIHCSSSILYSLPKLEGKSNSEAADNVKKRIVPTMTANYMLWPMAQVYC